MTACGEYSAIHYQSLNRHKTGLHSPSASFANIFANELMHTKKYQKVLEGTKRG